MGSQVGWQQKPTVSRSSGLPSHPFQCSLRKQAASAQDSVVFRSQKLTLKTSSPPLLHAMQHRLEWCPCFDCLLGFTLTPLLGSRWSPETQRLNPVISFLWVPSLTLWVVKEDTSSWKCSQDFSYLQFSSGSEHVAHASQPSSPGQSKAREVTLGVFFIWLSHRWVDLRTHF